MDRVTLSRYTLFSIPLFGCPLRGELDNDSSFSRFCLVSFLSLFFPLPASQHSNTIRKESVLCCVSCCCCCSCGGCCRWCTNSCLFRISVSLIIYTDASQSARRIRVGAHECMCACIIGVRIHCDAIYRFEGNVSQTDDGFGTEQETT